MHYVVWLKKEEDIQGNLRSLKTVCQKISNLSYTENEKTKNI